MVNSSSKPWAKPCQIDVDGFTFDRLISDRDVHAEGATQRHCVASYTYQASIGRIFIFKITGRERATLSFFKKDGIDQIKGFANAAVSKTCRRAALTAINRFLAKEFS